jgi:ribonuclease E
MSKQIIIAEEHRIAAVFDDDQIQELIVATGTHQVGDIYLGIVENVLPSIDAAFVNIGDTDRNGFIHVTDLGPLKLRKTAGSITELLAPQQKVLVQVMKEPTGSKGPRLTGNVSLPGRYIVLMPYGRGVNLSRRIRNENERNRLRALAILIKPAGMGMVVRTEAENIPEEAIIEDMEALQRSWEGTTEEALANRAPALLTRDDDFIQKVLRDAYSDDVNRIVADSALGLKGVKQHLTTWGGGRLPQGLLVDHHRERTPILEYFRVNAAIREALKPRVDLPSGGYIIIEKTEALTVIDVNSGSFTRSQTSRETVLWTNCEAASELARQMRLRNIAGVIVVDFIDMDSRRDQQQVLEHFNRALQEDKAKPQIAQLTELGLVELTRKRQGKNIYELFGQACGTCGGVGLLAKLPGEEGSQTIQPGYDRVPDSSPRESRRPETRNQPQPQPQLQPTTEYTDEYGDSSLELMHHPSYQERSGGRGRGRGRRRRGELALPKEPVTPRMSPWEEEARYNNRGPSREPEEAQAFDPVDDLPLREARSERPTRGERPERIERSERPERGDREERGERPERADRRGRGRRDRFPSEPPEFVHVEMTADEQEVYSWMGISPLVLTEQIVKNPRNAYIAVTLPGEAAPEQPVPVVSSVSEVKRRPTLLHAEQPDSQSFDRDDDDDLQPIAFNRTAPEDDEITPVETFEEPAPRRLIRQRSRVPSQEPIADRRSPIVEEEPIAAPKKKRIIIGQKLETVDAFSGTAAPAPIVLPDVTRMLVEPEEPEEEEDNPIVRRRRRRSSARS